MTAMPEGRMLVATIGPPMPVEAFVRACEAIKALVPDLEDLPDDTLLLSNTVDGGFEVRSRDVNTPWYFEHGHFELRWVDA